MKDLNNLPASQKEHLLGRSRSKFVADHTRKPRTVPKKCLDAEFASVSENGSGETEISSVSEVCCADNQVIESVESSIQPSVKPDNTECTDLILSSSTTIAFKEAVGSASESDGSTMTIASNEAVYSSSGSDGSSIASLEAEIAVKHLTQARTLIASSPDGDPRVKKLLDSLITVIINEFYGLSKERDLVIWRNRIMLVSFVLWILAVAAALILGSEKQSSFSGLHPT